ncbi:MAG: hypothetical protein PHD88_02435 [Firmicutes bacterium]|nr:hypothetical protein [Bacillota bacterium]MDD4693249.1 hypothetical protein [Bacillota bacterium]
MSRRLEKRRTVLRNREVDLNRKEEENYNLELEIDQIKREMKILETRIDYLSRN